MKSDQAFPSKYLKAADFAGGKRPHFQVARVEFENVGREDKPDLKPVMHVLYNGRPILAANGEEKGIVINQTNWGAIATDLGDESDAWIGHTIEFFSMRVQGPNGMTDGIRCRVIHPTDVAPAAASSFGGTSQPHPPVPLTPGHNIPSSSAFQQPVDLHQRKEPPLATSGSYGAKSGIDDSIPF